MRATTTDVSSVAAALSGAASVFHTIASPTRGASGPPTASDPRASRRQRAGYPPPRRARERDPGAALERARAEDEPYGALAGGNAHTLEHAVHRQDRLATSVHRRRPARGLRPAEDQEPPAGRADWV